MEAPTLTTRATSKVTPRPPIEGFGVAQFDGPLRAKLVRMVSSVRFSGVFAVLVGGMFAVSACAINPQPEPPQDMTGAGDAGTGGAGGSGGTTGGSGGGALGDASGDVGNTGGFGGSGGSGGTGGGEWGDAANSDCADGDACEPADAGGDAETDAALDAEADSGLDGETEDGATQDAGNDVLTQD